MRFHWKAGYRCTLQPGVKTASTYFKHDAHLLDGKYPAVICYDPEYLPSFLKKMFTAFFKMSRSICVSRSSFFSLATSSSASVNITLPFPGKLLVALLKYSLRHR